MKKILLVLISIMTALILLDLAYFSYGSINLYATDEQDEKVKLATVLIFFVLLFLNILFVALYRKAGTK